MDFLEMIKQLYSVEKVKGYAEHEINFVKELFGTLPQIIEDFWRIAGCTEELHYGQDHWITPDNFRKSSWLRDSDYLILLNENQGVCQAVHPYVAANRGGCSACQKLYQTLE